jgi:putative ABC transport system permease protein
MWLVATVDRRRRAEDLRALRWQGLSRRVVRRATLWGQLTVVLAGTVLGLVAAAVAWYAAGDQLPVDADLTTATIGWPAPSAVLGPWLAAGGVLVAVALLAAIDLRRAVSRPVPE